MRTPWILLGMLVARLAGAAESVADLQERAETLFSEGDWARAARDFEAAVDAGGPKTILYDLGQAQQNLGEFSAAVRAYSRYLAEVPTAANKEEVKRRVRELTPFTLGGPPPSDDRLAPRIAYTPPKSWSAGEMLTVEATITDSSGVFQPMLYYRLGQSGAFVPSGLMPSEGSHYLSLIPPMKPGQLQYYLEALDTQGNGPARNGTPTYPHTIRIDPAKPKPPPPPEVVKAPEAPPPPPPPPEPQVIIHTTRGPVAIALIGASALAAAAGVFFGMGATSSAEEWRAATDRVGQEYGRGRTEDAVLNANVSWVAAGLLAAAGGGLYFFTSF